MISLSISEVYVENGFFVTFDEEQKNLTTLFGHERVDDIKSKGYNIILTKDNARGLMKVASIMTHPEIKTVNPTTPA
jgi:hypothetical protein